MAQVPFIPSIEHKWGLIRLSTQQQWLGLTEREIVLVIAAINPSTYKEWLIWQNPQKDWLSLEVFLNQGNHEFQYKIPEPKYDLPEVAKGLIFGKASEQSKQGIPNKKSEVNNNNNFTANNNAFGANNKALSANQNAMYANNNASNANQKKIDSSNSEATVIDNNPNDSEKTDVAIKLETRTNFKIIDRASDLDKILQPLKKVSGVGLKGKGKK